MYLTESDSLVAMKMRNNLYCQFCYFYIDEYKIIVHDAFLLEKSAYVPQVVCISYTFGCVNGFCGCILQ